MSIKKGDCPNCERETKLKHIQDVEEINVKGELIPIEVEYYKCLECGSEFEDPRSKNDPLVFAYNEFRRRRGLMQPEDIKTLRKQYGFTQQEWSKLLGWGIATVSRYENGALQDDAHDTTLKLIKEDKRNLLNLVLKNGDFLPEGKKRRIIAKLQAEVEEEYSFENIYSERFGKYEPGILSGYRRLNLVKLFEMLKFFCKGGVLKTKLLKLPFYADFKHYKDFAVSITGAQYAHADHGPVPDNYDYYLATLHTERHVRIKEKLYPGKEYVGEEYVSEIEPDLSMFSKTELKILREVKKFFKHYSAGTIRKFSHEEVGYKETENGEIISYEYAEQLKMK